MGKLIRRLGGRGANAARRALRNVKTRILVAEGRKAVRRRVETARRVAGKAAKAGLVVGTAVAAGVVTREIRKRHRLTGGEGHR